MSKVPIIDISEEDGFEEESLPSAVVDAKRSRLKVQNDAQLILNRILYLKVRVKILFILCLIIRRLNNL